MAGASAPVAIVQLVVENLEVLQVYGLQDHHRLVCHALGIACAWYEAPSSCQNDLMNVTPVSYTHLTLPTIYSV